MQGTQIVPCTSSGVANPQRPSRPRRCTASFLYDLDKNTQVPAWSHRCEGIEYTDIVAALAASCCPNIILDKVPGVDSGLRVSPTRVSASSTSSSVQRLYQDGVYDSPKSGLSLTQVSDPTQLSLADPRRARFLRIEKAVGIPDKNRHRQFTRQLVRAQRRTRHEGDSRLCAHRARWFGARNQECCTGQRGLP